MNKVVNASPTKEFFVNMLVRDILLKQAIIELIDNSIDGARRFRKNNEFSGLKIEIEFDSTKFFIQDNCGGIPLDVATERAFRFGRPQNIGKENAETTGIFGIGMKRALFKIGKKISIHSETIDTAFQLDLDVDEWLRKDDRDWDFELTSYQENVINPIEAVGTRIEITNLNLEIATELSNSEFKKEVIEHIQRRVGQDIVNGMSIKINGDSLVGDNVLLIDNEELKPIKEEYKDDGITVRILSGIAPRDGKNYPPEKAGWYIYCNGRLIVAADKTSLTTWKDMENKSSGVVFHNNYAGFRGIVYFNSVMPEKLPWNTTKTGLDTTSLVYLRAREKMLEIFKIVKNILDDIRENSKTNDDGIEETIAAMRGTEMTLENINKVKQNRSIDIHKVLVATKPQVSISYKKPKEEVETIKKFLGVKSYKEVGEKTFEYFKDAEC